MGTPYIKRKGKKHFKKTCKSKNLQYNLILMARVTTEDCITSIPNRFQLVIYACNRARDLSSGSQAGVSIDNDKNTVIALREIAEKKIDLVKTWDSIVVSSLRYQPVELSLIHI